MASFIERFIPINRRERNQPALVHPEAVQQDSGVLNQDRIRLFTSFPKAVNSRPAPDENDPDTSFKEYVSRLRSDYKKSCEATAEALDKDLMETRLLTPDEIE